MDLDLDTLHGDQGMTDEDRAYAGSRYADVKAAAFDNPYPRDGDGHLPVFRSTLRNAFSGILPFGRPEQARIAAARTVDSSADLRWGEDGRGYRKILHPNGIVLFGAWEITEDNPYTGYFAPGSRGLLVGRWSSHGTETRRSQVRSIGLVGKLYPTEDPDHTERLRPAGFITQQDLGGERTRYANDVELTNTPSNHSYRRGIMTPVLLRAGLNFIHHDKVPDSRQLYEVAELAKPEATPTRAPEHMKLKMAPGQMHVEGGDVDYRDELLAHLDGDGTLVLDVSVSDDSRVKGRGPLRVVKVRNWRRIGSIAFTEGVVSYNGDHVLHFHHPGWREDRNDPATAIRVGERRVR